MKIKKLLTNLTLSIPLAILLVVGTFFVFAHTVQAAQFSGIRISNVEMVQDTKLLSASFTLSVKNADDFEERQILYGVRIQDKSGALAYESKAENTLTIRPNQTVNAEVTIDLPAIQAGQYDALIVAREKSGIILSASYAGKVNISEATETTTTEPTKVDKPQISNCSLKEGDGVTFVCNLQNVADNSLKYNLFKGSSYGELISSGEAEFTKVEGQEDEYTIKTDNDSMQPGRYEAVFSFVDKNTKEISKQFRVMFSVSGDWATIDRYNLQILGTDKANVAVYIVGNQYSEQTRGFKYWVLDKDGKACIAGEIDLNNLTKRKYTDTVTFPRGCESPNLAGFLYVGNTENGGFNMVESIGDADFSTLLKNTPLYGSTLNNIKKLTSWNIGAIVSVLLLIIVLVVVLFLLKRVGVLAIFFVLAGVAGIANAAWPVELGNMVFNVEMAKTEYQTNEPMSATIITFQDKNTGNKPLNAIVEFKNETQGGTYSTIVSSSYGGSISIKELPAIASAGDYTLRFRIPGLCGIFGSGLFGLSLFGQSSCEFDVPVTVISNPPTLTLISDPVAVPSGANTTLRWIVTNANSCTATGAWVGGRASAYGSYAEQSGTLSGVGNHSFNLSCSNTSGSVPRTASVASYNCGDNVCTTGESCTVCQQDCGTCDAGGSPSVSISAYPRLMQSENTSKITWSTSNTTSCTVTENNNLIDDSWLGAVGSETTSKISETTKYTLSCETSEGKFATSTTVYMAPDWQER